MGFVNYKNKSVEVVNVIRLDRIEIRNMVVAVEYQEAKKMLSCLIGWLIVAIVYVETNKILTGYLIVKKIK